MGTNKKIQEEIEEVEIEVNQKLLDQFTKNLQKSINQVCKKNPELDPRVELLIALGSFAAQVAQDLGQDEEDFLDMMNNLFTDSLEEEPTSEEPVLDKMQIN